MDMYNKWMELSKTISNSDLMDLAHVIVKNEWIANQNREIEPELTAINKAFMNYEISNICIEQKEKECQKQKR